MQHHVHRQRLICALAGLSPARAGVWYDRLERLQESTILPCLERELDRYAPADRTVYLDRVEVTVEIDDPDRIEAIAAASLGREIARQLRGVEAPSFAPTPPDVAADVVYYLRTGALPWKYATPADFTAAVAVWLPRASPADWAHIFRQAQLQVARFLGRGAQVNSQFLRVAWQQLHLTSSGTPPPSLPPTDPEAWLAAIDRVLSPTPPTATPRQAKANAHPARIDTEKAYYPENAGCVLLLPYFDHLCRTAGLVDGHGRLPDPGRAATLLHYTVWGRTDPREWDLPLTKVLLGVDPREYLACPQSLTPAERAAADEVLDGIIEHWSALGSTGRDGLREGFLQRNGKLWSEADGWRLAVENKAYDVLLDRLPWSFRLGKTPWMGGLLQTDWR